MFYVFILGSAGAFIGYLLATISESWLHRTVGHAPSILRRRWAKCLWFGKQLSNAHYGHAILHHGRTFRRNHVTQFASAAEQQDLDQHLHEQGKEIYIGLRYGLRTDIWGALLYVAAPATGCISISWLLLGHLSVPFLVAAALPVCSTPLLSILVHPYLHLPISRADSEAPKVVRWLLKTWYGDWARKQHYVHHRTPRVNFNLLPGGDILLRTSRKPTAAEILEMQRIGLIADDH